MSHKSPLAARTETRMSPHGPSIFNCVQFSFIRHGTAIISNGLREYNIRAGDALILAPNTVFTIHPEGSTTTTTLYVDINYLIDQSFWRYAAILSDRDDAWDLISSRFPDPTLIVNIGADRIGLMAPWLDRLVEMDLEGAITQRFFRMQADLASVLDVLSPFLETSQGDHIDQADEHPQTSPLPSFGPLRHEALILRETVEDDISQYLTLKNLASKVHLSSSQAHRIFVETYNTTPLAHQTTLRAHEMARLIRTTQLPIQDIARRVGWKDRSHAARSFRRVMGVNPQDYRRLIAEK